MQRSTTSALATLAALVAATALSAACKGEPDDTPWCTDQQPAPTPVEREVTWFRDVKPLFDQKCTRCHVDDGIAPFALSSYEQVWAYRESIRATVASRHMPPWLAARCCNEYFHDVSLTDEEIGVVLGWVDQGAVEGDPATEPEPLPPLEPLSRVDVVLEMAETYTPKPPHGSTDDLRCFVMDWPYDTAKFVTGFNPVPGTREVVHHLVVAAVAPDSVDDLKERDAADSGPGFDCSGGFGDIDWQDIKVLGGSLQGGDFPRGLGSRVEPGSKIVVNIHYSTVKSAKPDRTRIELRVDDEATEAKGIALANPAWLIDDAMSIPAGEKDAVFFFELEPDLFTWDKRVRLQSITPHMHNFATKVVVRAFHDDDRPPTCLLEIPDWHFGWEQPFWLAEPVTLGEDDRLYIECHFDNSAANQPNGGEPRDIAWGGNNQDMCAAFLAFTVAE